MPWIRCGGGGSKKFPINTLKGKTIRGVLSRSGEGYNVTGYLDGTVVVSTWAAQYGGGSWTMSSNSSSIIDGGFTMLLNKSGINNDTLSVSITINGVTFASKSGNMYGTIDTGTVTIN